MRPPATCPGCSETRHVRPYAVRFLPAGVPASDLPLFAGEAEGPDALPGVETVWYCDDCAELAEAPDGGWSGTVAMIRPILDERDALEVRFYREYRGRGASEAEALRVARNSMRY